MDNIKLKTPEGYFEESFTRTMAGVATIRKKRRAVLGVSAAVAVILVAAFSFTQINNAHIEKEYMAFQAEMADYDIFLEIN